jgi:type IV pilus assembly protein PilE
MHQAKGFTLLELMVTVMVVAILAAIALPSYSDYVLRSKFVEATGNLADLRIKMEQYYMDNRSYSTAGDNTICGIPGLPNGNTPTAADARYFTYRCAPSNPAGLGAQQYVLTAIGVAAQGLGGLSFTVNEANAKTTAVDAASNMANRGYTVGAPSATCWMRKKPAEC